MKRKAAFVDRDGILNELIYDEVHGILDSPRRPEQVVLMKGASEFLNGLHELGYFIAIVTNQPGIAKGTLTEQELEAVHATIAGQLRETGGGTWDALYYSPYHPKPGPWGRKDFTRDSNCRKPGPGMLMRAAEDHDLDLDRSWMIGDGLVDVQAGKAAGCRTMLVTKLKISHIERFLDMKDAEPDEIAPNLKAALERLKREGGGA